MLDEYKEMYKRSADVIPGWLKMDKNDLCRECLMHEHDPLYDNYIAALIYRYWGLISKFYNMSTNLADPDDCYNWLIDSIMYALKHRQWENPNSSIYNEHTGPDKVINRCMKSSRLIYYQFNNRKKRKKDFQIISIDNLKDDANSDNIELEDPSANLDDCAIDIYFLIEQTFRKKEFFLAFILDCICIEDVFDKADNEIKFNLKRLAKYFRQIDSSYILYFSQKYNIDYEEVYQAAILAKNIPDAKLTSKIEDTLLRLKHSDIIKILTNRR